MLAQHMSGGQNYILSAMDMAKVGGPLSVASVFAQTEHPMSTPHYFSLPLICGSLKWKLHKLNVSLRHRRISKDVGDPIAGLAIPDVWH